MANRDSEVPVSVVWCSEMNPLWLQLPATTRGGFSLASGGPAHRSLWDIVTDGRDRISSTSANSNSQPERRVNIEERHRARLEGKLSPALYSFAVVATLRSSWIAQAFLLTAALIWLIPDQRIEKRLAVSNRLAIGPR